jgi:hypothetical protein
MYSGVFRRDVSPKFERIRSKRPEVIISDDSYLYLILADKNVDEDNKRTLSLRWRGIDVKSSVCSGALQGKLKKSRFLIILPFIFEMATWTKIEVKDTEQFDSVVAEQAQLAAQTGQPLYVVITSDFSNEEMCERWCPDCRSADPFIYGALDKKKTGILVECPVPRSSYRGNPDHPYRKHSTLQIKAIPTLINWANQSRLVEEECYDAAKVDAFFEIQ